MRRRVGNINADKVSSMTVDGSGTPPIPRSVSSW
jgi:hypothetical protein